jgi:hypothetical protein
VRRCRVAQSKTPVFYEYRLGGGCVAGVETKDPTIEAILDAIPEARQVYAPQGRLTIFVEKAPEDGGAA